MSDELKPPREILDYYRQYAEESRLEQGPFRLEFVRTQELLEALLPPPPARVLDVGGAAGTYALWLAGRGYDVELIEPVERLVAVARERSRAAERPIHAFHVADARELPVEASSADAVLLLGPLYHLIEQEQRARVLSEAFRALKPGGVVAAAAISRFASLLDGMARELLGDPEFARMVEGDLATGVHRNRTSRMDYFTTAYFHEPGELANEIEAAGMSDVVVYGVEGPGWLLPDLDARWQDGDRREQVLEAARRIETAPSARGISAHLLAVGRR